MTFQLVKITIGDIIPNKGDEKMKKVIIVVFCFLLLASSVLFISCSNKSSNNSNNSANNITGSSANSKAFTVDELKTYDGQNGNAAYVAVDGTVYDVTNAKRWKSGKHENGIVAGVDLTSAMPDSPHGNDVLKDLPVVGTLSK